MQWSDWGPGIFWGPTALTPNAKVPRNNNPNHHWPV